MTDSGHSMVLQLTDPEATTALGEAIATGLGTQITGLITLSGGLGAGKTHLVRGLLRTLGVTGPIKSPTYTLVEPYELSDGRCFHLDLYRLADVDEWWGLGLEDDPPDQSLWCVEWPERAGAALPPARLMIELRPTAVGREAILTWRNAQDPMVKIVINRMKIVL